MKNILNIEMLYMMISNWKHFLEFIIISTRVQKRLGDYNLAKGDAEKEFLCSGFMAESNSFARVLAACVREQPKITLSLIFKSMLHFEAN